MPFMRISPVKGSNEVQVETIEVPHLRLNEEQRAAAMRAEREVNRRAERYQSFTPVKSEVEHAPVDKASRKGASAKEGDDGKGSGAEGSGEGPEGEGEGSGGEDGAPPEDGGR